jgi:hypothetical protein
MNSLNTLIDINVSDNIVLFGIDEVFIEIKSKSIVPIVVAISATDSDGLLSDDAVFEVNNMSMGSFVTPLALAKQYPIILNSNGEATVVKIATTSIIEKYHSSSSAFH